MTERLVKENPEIELHEGKPVEDLFHRRDDIPSFWGGAAIRSGGTCSTGFTVRKPSGARFITTAAHCYRVGSIVRTPTGTFVGTVTQRGTLELVWFWDNRDVELIGGSSYGARVYTGGVFSTTSRGVVGAGDPVAGFTGYCSSGQTTGEQCNQTVQSTGAIVCTQTGCKWPVIEYTGGPAQPGDSGGSFYLPERLELGVRARRGHRRRRRDELRGAVEPHLVLDGRLDRHLSPCVEGARPPSPPRLVQDRGARLTVVEPVQPRAGLGQVGHVSRYLIVTQAPAATRAALNLSAASRLTFSRTAVGAAFDEVLGLLEAEAGVPADDLDDLDLVVAGRLEDEVELLLLLGRGADTAAGGRRDDRRRGVEDGEGERQGADQAPVAVEVAAAHAEAVDVAGLQVERRRARVVEAARG